MDRRGFPNVHPEISTDWQAAVGAGLEIRQRLAAADPDNTGGPREPAAIAAEIAHAEPA